MTIAEHQLYHALLALARQLDPEREYLIARCALNDAEEEIRDLMGKQERASFQLTTRVQCPTLGIGKTWTEISK